MLLVLTLPLVFIQQRLEFDGDSQITFSVAHGQSVFGGPTMLTPMTEEDWTIVLIIRGIALTPRRQGTERPEVSRSPAVFRGSRHHLAGSAEKVWALEQCLEAVLALEPIWNFRSFLRCAGGNEPDGASGADVRFHRGACLVSAAGAKGGRTIRRSADRVAASRPRFT